MIKLRASLIKTKHDKTFKITIFNPVTFLILALSSVACEFQPCVSATNYVCGRQASHNCCYPKRGMGGRLLVCASCGCIFSTEYAKLTRRLIELATCERKGESDHLLVLEGLLVVVSYCWCANGENALQGSHTFSKKSSLP